MWNYSELAKTYDNRPKYSEEAIDFILKKTNAKTICDIGAGTGILTCQLMERKQVENITPVEPNEEMSKIGIKKTKLNWVKGNAECTGLDANNFDLITYGSSFNVCNQDIALTEAKRILKKNGFIACLWNHRNLNDNLQKKIENIIKEKINGYDYGERRKDQTKIFERNNLKSEYYEFEFEFEFEKNNFMKAMNSHYTLKNQSKEKFKDILKEIRKEIPNNFIVPYKTVLWIAQ